MNKKNALEFLKRHQPMPDDEHLNEDLIKKYDCVRRYFIDNPDIKCIPLFLNSFGEIDGFGVYQLVEDVIKKFSKKEVLPHIIESLYSKNKGVKYWNAQIASIYPDPKLVKPLEEILKTGDSDLRSASITALAFIKDNEVGDILEEALEREDDDQVKDFLEEVINDRKIDKV